MKINSSWIVVLVCFLATPLAAQPDFTHQFRFVGITFIPDVKQSKVCYYLPGDLVIGTRSDGRPDMSFVMMRYTGSAVYNESEEIRYRSIFSIRLVMNRPQSDSMAIAKRELAKIKPNVTIRPLPVTDIEALVVFTPVGSDSVHASRGALSADNDDGYNTNGAYWQERYFTLHLNNHSAMLLRHALTNNQTAISFMYAFHARGSTTKQILDYSGAGKLKRQLIEQLRLDEFTDTDTTLRDCIVKSNAFEIAIDTTLHADLIRQIDINDGVPPGYAVLNVRNYDFANKLRSDLYEKTVELEAVGAGGKKVSTSITFHSHTPEITSTHFKFKYAVRLDKPYRYRIRELYLDGRENITEWTEETMWSRLLDITSRPSTHH